jgi:hypothetical protein
MWRVFLPEDFGYLVQSFSKRGLKALIDTQMDFGYTESSTRAGLTRGKFSQPIAQIQQLLRTITAGPLRTQSRLSDLNSFLQSMLLRYQWQIDAIIRRPRGPQ